jgi:hypothetical protein
MRSRLSILVSASVLLLAQSFTLLQCQFVGAAPAAAPAPALSNFSNSSATNLHRFSALGTLNNTANTGAHQTNLNLASTSASTSAGHLLN